MKFEIVLCAAALLASACNDDDERVADAGGGVVDARPLADARLDAMPPADAAVCPGTCIGDAVGDFSVAPGPGARFSYLDDTRVATDPFGDMIYAEWHGAGAWLGGGDEPVPAMLHCPSHPNQSECQGIESRLILAPGLRTATTRDPVLAWTSPLTGMVRIAGSYRAPMVAIAGKQRITISRNTRDDVIYELDWMPAQQPEEIDVQVAVQTGDRLLLTVAAPVSGFGAPVGFQLFFVDLN